MLANPLLTHFRDNCKNLPLVTNFSGINKDVQKDLQKILLEIINFRNLLYRGDKQLVMTVEE